MPAHMQIDLDKQKIAWADRFYLPHTAYIKHDVAFKNEDHIWSRFFILLYWSLFIYIKLISNLVLLQFLLTNLLLTNPL